MITRRLTGDVDWLKYGGMWVSGRLNNGDWDYWLVVAITNMDEACGCDNKGQPKYVVEIRAISPEAAGPENLREAVELCGDEGNNELTDLMKVELLNSYGVYSPCQSFRGNNGHKLLREAKKSLDTISEFFGFYMDGPKNRIGSTGWDCIAGNVMAGLNRS